MLSIRSLPAGLLVLALSTLVGCGDDDYVPPILWYKPQTTPANILDNLKTAYRFRDIDAYSKLFADDVYFFEDPTDGEHLPETWNRFADSADTERLFQSPQVRQIRLSLSYSAPQVMNEAGREHWLRIDVADSFFELDLVTPSHPDGVTQIIDGYQPERIYFRKGRTEADRLTTSATSSLYFIVEWKNKPTAIRTIAED
jgi:hypothetical protein